VPSSPDHDGRAATLDGLRQVIRRLEQSRPPRPAPEPAEKVLGGELIDTGAGPLLVVRREFPLVHRHGRLDLAGAAAVPESVLSLVGRRDEEVVDPRGLLFLDTETTGLAGGTGTYAFLVGTGWIEADRFVVVQHFMRDLDEEPALVAALEPLLARASALVTFNGTGFDVPLLETRFIMARRRWPALAHVDLLRPARRVWGRRVPDCRLATLEREVLGLERVDDVAGALIPSLYFAFLRHRHAAPLGRVFAHNRDDVLSLAALLGWFAGTLAREPERLAPEDLAGLGRLWEPADPARAADCYRAALAAGLEGPEAHLVCLWLARWEKRRARWEEARALWERATDRPVFDPLPWEELAKLHEHRRRDFSAARAVVTSALDLARTAHVSARVRDAFVYRLARLDRRLARVAPGSPARF
jgi:uncharacterized protein YprB with RNaseH-like and TPR domain